MAVDSSLNALRKISKPQTFPKGTMICREGMPGLHMYIVIQGKVGVYIDTILDERVKVAEVQGGGFFGEMSIFDQKPRSATCIAMEDTICVAVSRHNLRDFIIHCPDMTENLMSNLSERLRAMNDHIYKSAASIAPGRFAPFSVPPPHKPHPDVETPPVNAASLIPFQDKCPVCGKSITLQHIQTYTLSLIRMENNMRRIYKELNVLWHYLWSCSECGYTNFSTNFHQVPDSRRPVLEHIVAQQMQYHEKYFQGKSVFDELLFQYYQAMHINECVNSGDSLLIGKLWLYLHWLYLDVQDEDMIDFTRERALSFYEKAYDEGSRTLKSEDAQQQCAQVIAELYFEKADFDNARIYYHEVTKYHSQLLTRKAQDRIYQIRELKKKKREQDGLS